MATLIQAAQRLLDLYSQDYQTNDKFLDIDDFKYHIATVYSKLLNDMYQAERRANKQMDGFSNIEIPQSWLITETLKIEYDKPKNKFFSILPQPAYLFDFDNAVNGLQGIVGRPCLYRKISLNESKFENVIPPRSAIFFYLNTPTEIVYCGAKEGTSVEVQYVPVIVEQENDCKLSDNIIATLTPIVLDMMFKAKNGNFVDKTDDQNKNVSPVQQLNPSLSK